MRRLARCHMNSFEAGKHAKRRFESLRLGEIELNDFIAGDCAGILHLADHSQRLPAFSCNGTFTLL